MIFGEDELYHNLTSSISVFQNCTSKSLGSKENLTGYLSHLE